MSKFHHVLLRAAVLQIAVDAKDGTTHGPAYYNGNGHLRIGGAAHVNRVGDGCGYADLMARARALKDINLRNATYCAAIADLYPLGDPQKSFLATLVELDAAEQTFLDYSPSKSAMQAGLKLISPDNQNVFTDWVGTTQTPWQESTACINNGGNGVTGGTCPIKPVHGMIAASYSGTSGNIFSLFNSYDTAMVSEFATNPSLSIKSGNAGRPNFFRTTPPDSYKMISVINWLSAWEIKKIFIVTVNDDFPIGMTKALLSAANAKTLAAVEASIYLPSVSADQSTVVMDTLVNNFKASGTRVIVIVGLAGQTKKFVKHARDAGVLNGDLGYWAIHPEAVQGVIGPEFEGTFSVVPGHSLKTVWKTAFNIDEPPADVYFADVDKGVMANDPFVNTHVLNSKMCGVEQTVKCDSTTIGHSGLDKATGGTAHFTWPAVSVDHSLCTGYVPFSYDAMVIYAIAFDIGLRFFYSGNADLVAHGFDIDSATPKKIYAILVMMSKGTLPGTETEIMLDKNGTPTKLKEFYSTCMGSGGKMNFVWDDALGLRQERLSDIAVTNVRYANPGDTAPKNFYVVDLPSGGPDAGKAVERTSEMPLLKFGTGTKIGYSTNPADSATKVVKGELGVNPYCAPGTFLSVVTGACVPTQPGYYQPQADQDDEIPCPKGTYCANGGCAVCKQCAPGNFQNNLGQSKCEPCAAGQYASASGSEVCLDCAAGTYNPDTQKSSCRLCEIGSVQPLTGKANCLGCPPGRSTLFQGSKLWKQCLCDKNSYEKTPIINGVVSTTGINPLLTKGRVIDVGNGAQTVMDYPDNWLQTTSSDDDMPTCAACYLGMTCPIGSTFYDGVGEKHVLHGYWHVVANQVVPLEKDNLSVSRGFYLKSAVEPLTDHIFACDALGIKALDKEGYASPCKGGKPGVLGCQPNMEGIACAVCSPDHYQNTDGLCQKCKGGDGLPFLIFLLCVPLLLIFAYFIVNSRMTNELSPVVVVAISFGSLITTMQSCAVLSSISVSWPSELQGIFAIVQVFAFDMRVLKAECISGSSVTGMFVGKILTPYVLCGMLFGIAAMTRKMFPGVTTQKDGTTKRDWRAMHIPQTKNTFGTFYQAAFISILLSIVQPFRTYKHPGTGGHFSLISAPNLTTDDDEYTTMLLFAFLGMIPTGLFIIFYVWAVLNAPYLSRTVGPEYSVSIKFVLFRFHPEAYWWGLPFLCRSIVIAFLTILDPERPFMQTILLIATLLVYLAFQCLVWPWKKNAINYLDAFQSVCVILMTAAASAFIGTTDTSTQKEVSRFVISMYVLVMGSLLGFVTRQVLDTFNRSKQQKIQERRAHRNASISEAFIKMAKTLRDTDPEHTKAFLHHVSDTDRDRIRRMLFMVAVELVPEEEESASQIRKSSASGDGDSASRKSGMSDTLGYGGAFGVPTSNRRIRSNHDVTTYAKQRNDTRKTAALILKGASGIEGVDDGIQKASADSLGNGDIGDAENGATPPPQQSVVVTPEPAAGTTEAMATKPVAKEPEAVQIDDVTVDAVKTEESKALGISVGVDIEKQSKVSDPL